MRAYRAYGGYAVFRCINLRVVRNFMLSEHICKVCFPNSPQSFHFFGVHKLFSSLAPQTNHSTLLARPHRAPPNRNCSCALPYRPISCESKPFHFPCAPQTLFYLSLRAATIPFRMFAHNNVCFPACTNQFVSLRDQTMSFSLRAQTSIHFYSPKSRAAKT